MSLGLAFGPANQGLMDAASGRTRGGSMRARAMGIAGLLVLALGVQAALAGAAWSATGWTAYVANHGSNTVTTISTATNAATGTAIPVGTQPFYNAITPDGKTVYVPNQGSNTVTPISTATNTAGTPITVG